MAVTRGPYTIHFGAAAEAITDIVYIQRIRLDHSAAANATVTDTEGIVIATLHSTTSELTKEITFDPPIRSVGVIVSALSAGTVDVVVA